MPRVPRSCSIFVGCAGWNLRRDDQHHFAREGSHLERYASMFPAVEINSSFYRAHRPITYARWAAVVPDSFRFSVKVPKEITHTNRLCSCDSLLQSFIDETSQLSVRLGCYLLQLPPSLVFDAHQVRGFLEALRALSSLPVVCEPRHPSWFAEGPEALLREFNIARAAVDPALSAEAKGPGGADEIAYYRLHGSPKMYYSAYTSEYLRDLAQALQRFAATRATWCIFDNTAEGAAIRNALELLELLSQLGS